MLLCASFGFLFEVTVPMIIFHTVFFVHVCVCVWGRCSSKQLLLDVCLPLLPKSTENKRMNLGFNDEK